MDQNKIWDAFQNDEDLLDVGFPARKRFEYLGDHIPKSSKTLNIGIGKGYLEEILVEKGVEIYCLDPSEGAMRKIRERLRLGDRAQAGYSQSIPFDDEMFDFVVMSEVLEHLDDTILAATLTEVRRVLKPGGVFLGTVPADENLKQQIVICPDCGKNFHRWGHEQSFSETRLKKLLGSYFHRVEIKRIFFLELHMLNWKGKLTALLKLFQATLGIRGTNQNFFFAAEKECLKRYSKKAAITSKISDLLIKQV